jgi:hypothetical protein
MISYQVKHKESGKTINAPNRKFFLNSKGRLYKIQYIGSGHLTLVNVDDDYEVVDIIINQKK